MRLGIIARSDNTGLGNQTKELVDMLKPDKVLLIDSTSFNNNQQFPERYADYNVTVNPGFIKDKVAAKFLQNLDVVLSCETFYSKSFIEMARRAKVKTVLQYNYEFLDNLVNPKMPIADILISPSTWNIDDIKHKFSNFTNIYFLPPPLSLENFKNVQEINLSKKHNRILHVGGKAAHYDRNGTEIILEMLKYSKGDYEIVITSQTKLENITDSRVTIQYENKINKEDLYVGFDAMVLPRRYGGLCLPMNESLAAGLPVFMSDISPNNDVLPSKWLTPASYKNNFMARTIIDCFETNLEILANKLDNYMTSNSMPQEKLEAVSLSKIFDPDRLKPLYLDILSN